jgi:hypothetical protein
MTWSIWRQHRAEGLAAAAVLAVAAVLVRGMTTGQSGTALASQWLIPMQGLLIALPALVGLFLGAPLLAHDLEQGIHRLLWTQGVTRGRWLGVKLLLVFATVAAGAALLAGLTSWGIDTGAAAANAYGRVDVWSWFDQQGPAFVGYVLFALALGVALGALLGRTYPAMALTLVLFAVIRAVVNAFLRTHYLPPLQASLSTWNPHGLPGGGPYESLWVAQGYTTLSGQPLTNQQAFALLGAVDGQGKRDLLLAPHGLKGWLLYQPGDRFWTFQGIEAGIFLVLAALLVALTVYWIGRRVS